MRAKLTLAAGAIALAAAAVAQERPESLLPPGFGQAPPPAPAPAPAATRAPVPGAPSLSPAPQPSGTLAPLPPLVLPSPTPSPTPTPSPMYEMPPFARRSLASIGPVGGTEAALPPNAFGRTDGRYLETLMRRLSAPLPSRWLSIALRRLLVSQLDTPANVNGADFAAERAWLLLRMGEAVGARAVVQSVDIDRVTPKLSQVWMQAMLANADPAGLCTLSTSPRVRASERGWIAAQAMCAGLAGSRAQPLVRELRRRRISGIDLQLAQKVMGAGANSRQAITIEWDPVIQLTAWRYGLATATGVPVPEALYATVGPQLYGWRAQAPAITLAERAAPAERAATMGVISNAALVDLYSAGAEADDQPATLRGVADSLRDAYLGQDRATRLDAMAGLWNAEGTPGGRYGRLILTARAAGRLAVFDAGERTPGLVASMLSAGLDRTAQRWRSQVATGTDAWAMLLLADPDGAAIGYGEVNGYAPAGGNAARKKQLLFAAMAGLGRLSASDVERGAEAFDLRIGAGDSWTRALDRAAAAGEPGTVLLLAATGMQANDWGGVPPVALYRITGALRAVGLGGVARMIAVEALTRL